MGVLIIAEHNNQTLSASILPVVTAAKQLSNKITVLVAGHDCVAVADAVSRVEGVTQVSLAQAEYFQHHLAEELAPLIIKQVEDDIEYLMAPSSTFGKNLMPRVAALLDVAQISDIINIKSADTFVRTTYAGNVLATIQTQDPIKVITVRASAFEPASHGDKQSKIASITVTPKTGLSTFHAREVTKSKRPDLNTARVVVSGGRGLGNAENFKLIEEIADKLGAAIGASRAAVDGGYISNDHQVGQTGKVVAPELYIAIGISGAIQHLAGMKDSKVIVAINKDPEAPIFESADYGLVADLFDVLPKLCVALGK